MTPIAVTAAEREAPAGWDARTVSVPGGHVLQGRAWAEHRRRQGWQPWFLSFADGRAALLLSRPQPPLPGLLAYVPRGPVSHGDRPEQVALRAAGIAEWCRGDGGTIVAVDPELQADDGYERALAEHGFRPTEEIQPSRHRLVLSFPPVGTADAEEQLWRGVSKGTRQRIRAAEGAGLSVAEDAEGRHLEDLGTLMDATADRRGFHFRAESGFVDWWRRVLGAGQARFFIVRHDDLLIGGLLAYLQGGHFATAFSADRADLRDRFPGAMHLLRWTVIHQALGAGAPAIDLGGVDVRGARGRPSEGDPSWGMYQHKASFGAEWVESAGAHERVLRPWVYRAGLGLRAIRRSVERTRH